MDLLFDQILIQDTKAKLSFRLDQLFLQGKLNLLALLALFLPVEDDDWVLVRRDVLSELPHGPHPLLAEQVFGQDPLRLILLLFLGHILII